MMRGHEAPMAQTHFDEHYNEAFYKEMIDGSMSSARVILPLLYDIYQPRSVIDIGCGQGAWLAVAESLGSTELVGLDGDWVKQECLLSKNMSFIPTNLEAPIHLDRRYDLCMSLEVAEHLSETQAKSFIDTLCKASDVIIFSAAIRYQGGEHHINEQWQSYWKNLFHSNGYSYFDIFRADIWNNNNVEWWYRQNIFLFVYQNCHLIDLQRLKILEKNVVDIVHPDNYESKIQFYESKIQFYESKIQFYDSLIHTPTLRLCLGCAKRYVLTKIRTGISHFSRRI